MNTTDIIRQITSETGIDFIGSESLDLVPLNDLNIHKTEVWSLSITDAPDNYFLKMDQQYRNKIGYRFRFKIDGPDEGFELCKGLSRELGGGEPQAPDPLQSYTISELYLAVHIHPEFLFTPKNNTKTSATQALKMCFI